MPPLSAIYLPLVWSQSVEQLPPIWWFVSNQTEFEQVVSVQAFTWRLFCLSLPASAENIGKQCLRNLLLPMCSEENEQRGGCCRDTLIAVAVFYS